MLATFSSQILKTAKRNSKIVLLHGDEPEESTLQEFNKHFPDQIFQFGLNSSAMISSAAGMALRNKIPIIFCTANQIFQNYSEIRSLIAYPNLNVKFILPDSGISQNHSSPQNNFYEDIAIARTLPNIKIAAPADKQEAQAVIDVAINEIGPCFVRLHNGKKEIFKHKPEFSFGNNQALKEGEEICIFSYGAMLETALEAAKHFEKKLKSVAVINLSSILPIDIDLIINYAEKAKVCVVLEDHNVLGGLGTIVSEVLISNHPKKLLTIGVEEPRLKFGTGENIKKMFGIDLDSVIEKIQEAC